MLIKKIFFVIIIQIFTISLLYAKNIIVYTQKRFIDLNKYIPTNDLQRKLYINMDSNYYNLIKFNIDSAKQCKIISHFLICNFNKYKKITLLLQEIDNKTYTIKNYYFLIFYGKKTQNINHKISLNFIKYKKLRKNIIGTKKLNNNFKLKINKAKTTKRKNKIPKLLKNKLNLFVYFIANSNEFNKNYYEIYKLIKLHNFIMNLDMYNFISKISNFIKDNSSFTLIKENFILNKDVWNIITYSSNIKEVNKYYKLLSISDLNLIYITTIPKIDHNTINFILNCAKIKFNDKIYNFIILHKFLNKELFKIIELSLIKKKNFSSKTKLIKTNKNNTDIKNIILDNNKLLQEKKKYKKELKEDYKNNDLLDIIKENIN